MAKKYYAVRNGKIPGVYDSWAACKAQVDHFPGAIYKSFSTREEADGFLQGGAAVAADRPVKEEETAIAYVDGSYLAATKEFSCGAVLFYQGEKVTFSEKYQDPSLRDMRNVAGEIMGATVVIAYCIAQKIPALVIYHDYEGVAQWANGSWKANKLGTKAYAQTCQEAKAHLTLSFVKVKGHSGDRYNDEADYLAKKALGIVS